MSAHDNLKPCPFCGGPGNLQCRYSRFYDLYFVAVNCEICDASGKTYKSNTDPEENNWADTACEQACNAWNMRSGK